MKIRLAEVLVLMAFTLFGSTALVVKPSALSAVDLVYLRFFLVALMVGLPIMAINRKLVIEMSYKVHIAMTCTSIAIFVNMVLLFTGFKLAPILLCVAFFYVGPVFTTLARVAIGEQRLVYRQVIAIFLALVGLTSMGFGASTLVSSSVLIGCLSAFVGGILFGLIPIFEERCSEVSPMVSLAYQSLVAAFGLSWFSSVSAGWFLIESRAQTLPVLVLAVCFTLLPFWLWWKATRINSRISPMLAYADPIVASLIGVLVFNEPIGSSQSLTVAALILSVIIQIVPIKMLDQVVFERLDHNVA